MFCTLYFVIKWWTVFQTVCCCRKAFQWALLVSGLVGLWLRRGSEAQLESQLCTSLWLHRARSFWNAATDRLGRSFALLFCCIVACSALLSSTSLRELTVTEYCAQHSKEVVDAVASRQIAASSAFSWSMAQQRGVQEMHNSSTHAAGGNTTLPRTAADCAWLPPLVIAANSRAVQQGSALTHLPQQQQLAEGEEQGQQTGHVPLRLKLQLLGPLQPQHQMLLLQLQGLVGLSVVKTPTWLGPHGKVSPVKQAPYAAGLPRNAQLDLSQIYPVLPTPLLRELRGLSNLSSLECTLGPPMMHKEKPAEVRKALYRQGVYREHT